MKKINKIINIALIFMLTRMFLYEGLVYALRPPLQFNELMKKSMEIVGVKASSIVETPIDEHLNSDDEYADVLREIINFGPKRKPSQATIERRDLLMIAYPEIVRSITAYFEKAYPDTDFSSLKIIITAGGSTLTGVAIDGSDLDLYFLIDDSELPERLKLEEGTKRNVALKARGVIDKMINERGLTGIRKLNPTKIYGEKVWFLSPILKSLESSSPNRKIGRYNIPIADAFLVCYGPAELVRRKLLSAIAYSGRYRKWDEVQAKWRTYVNNKHVKRLSATEGLNLNLPELNTMLIIYDIPVLDTKTDFRRHDIIDRNI